MYMYNHCRRKPLHPYESYESLNFHSQKFRQWKTNLQNMQILYTKKKKSQTNKNKTNTEALCMIVRIKTNDLIRVYKYENWTRISYIDILLSF